MLMPMATISQVAEALNDGLVLLLHESDANADVSAYLITIIWHQLGMRQLLMRATYTGVKRLVLLWPETQEVELNRRVKCQSDGT